MQINQESKAQKSESLTWTKLWHTGDIKSGHLTASWRINRTKCRMDEVQNGGVPTSNS